MIFYLSLNYDNDQIKNISIINKKNNHHNKVQYVNDQGINMINVMM